MQAIPRPPIGRHNNAPTLFPGIGASCKGCAPTEEAGIAADLKARGPLQVRLLASKGWTLMERARFNP
jgi:hypothetical protein